METARAVSSLDIQLGGKAHGRQATLDRLLGTSLSRGCAISSTRLLRRADTFGPSVLEMFCFSEKIATAARSTSSQHLCAAALPVPSYGRERLASSGSSRHTSSLSMVATERAQRSGAADSSCAPMSIGYASLPASSRSGLEAWWTVKLSAASLWKPPSAASLWERGALR